VISLGRSAIRDPGSASTMFQDNGWVGSQFCRANLVFFKSLGAGYYVKSAPKTTTKNLSKLQKKVVSDGQ
jgi:hypothetical protein